MSDAASFFLRSGLFFGRRFRVQYEDAMTQYYSSLAMKTLEEGLVKPAKGGVVAIPERLRDKAIVAQAPLRVDLSHGGGSDMFAICADRGGRVVNFSAVVNNSSVRVRVKRIDKPQIILHSGRAGDRPKVINKKKDIFSYSQPDDPYRLTKAALVVSGIVSEDDLRSLDEILESFGGGLEIKTECELPPESGLGVGGVLGAVLLSALFRISGQERTKEEVVYNALYMEQILGFAGGWQNFIGGIYGGIKVIISPPGSIPKPAVQNVEVDEDTVKKLEKRMVLCYTGPAHSEGLLFRLVGDYLSRKNIEFEARKRLEILDKDVIRTLERGDIDGLGEVLSQFWQDFKILNPGASSNNIERIFSEVKDIVVGGKACGVGGGGCMILIAKEGREDELRTRLNNLFERNDDLKAKKAAVWDYSIDFEGLTVEELDVKEHGHIADTDRLSPDKSRYNVSIMINTSA